MSTSDLLQEALALPAVERRTILAALLESFAPDELKFDDPELLAEWDRRSNDLEGAVTWDQLKAELDECQPMK